MPSQDKGSYSSQESFNQNYDSKTDYSNYDSSDFGYEYRGPLYERSITYTEDFEKKNSDKSFLFYSKSKDSVKHSISTTLTEKYIGATESLFYNTQNRRDASTSESVNIASQYDDSFSFKKQRVYDPEEYGRDSYKSDYYYHPYYNSKEGYYNWRY